MASPVATMLSLAAVSESVWTRMTFESTGR